MLVVQSKVGNLRLREIGENYPNAEDTAVEMVFLWWRGTDEEGTGIGYVAGNSAKNDELSVNIDLHRGFVQLILRSNGVGKNEKEMIPSTLAKSDVSSLPVLNRGC